MQEGLYLAGCHVAAKTQGYLLVCIWGSQTKFQGVGLFENHALCQTGFEEFFYRDLSLLVQSLVSPSNAGGVVSNWVSCCCTDTGLSCGVHWGWLDKFQGEVGLFEKPCFVPDLDLKSFSTGTYHCPLKLSVSLKWRGSSV